MKLANNLKSTVFLLLQEHNNRKCRKHLTNDQPLLISNNCLGGFMYHWLKKQFLTPFINLYILPDDYIVVLENFNDFLRTPIVQDDVLSEKMDFPVGRGYRGVKIYFNHYSSFEEAIDKWNSRLLRMFDILGCGPFEDIPTDRIGFIFSYGVTEPLLRRYEALDNFKHKVAFVDFAPPCYCKCAFRIKNVDTVGPIWDVENKWTGSRFVDQFNWVEFINSLY